MFAFCLSSRVTDSNNYCEFIDYSSLFHPCLVFVVFAISPNDILLTKLTVEDCKSISITKKKSDRSRNTISQMIRQVVNNPTDEPNLCGKENKGEL